MKRDGDGNNGETKRRKRKSKKGLKRTGKGGRNGGVMDVKKLLTEKRGEIRSDKEKRRKRGSGEKWLSLKVGCCRKEK